MKDLGFTREKVITYRKPFHCPQNAFYVSRRDIIRKNGRIVISGLDQMKHFSTFFPKRFIRLVSLTDFRIKVPAVVVKGRTRRRNFPIKLSYCIDVHMPQINKSDDNVSHLDPRVIDVILNLHILARGLKYSHEGIAQYRISDVSD